MTDYTARGKSLREDVLRLWATVDKSRWVALLGEIESELETIRLLEKESLANELWVLATLSSAHLHLIDAWDHNLKEAFNPAWCALERAELDLLFVAKNMDWCYFPEKVSDLRQHVKCWQALYPYGVFLSPEFLIHERKCNICETPRSPFAPCGHRKGKIYNGKLCIDLVTKMDMVGSAMVSDPVQKYSIIEPSNETAEDFSRRHAVIMYAMKLLENPHDLKNVEITKRRWPFSKFPGLKKGDPCPCESGKAFEVCCEDSEGVLRPHIQIYVGNVNVNKCPTIQYPNQ